MRVRGEEAEEARALLAAIEREPIRARLFTGYWAFDLVIAITLLIAGGVPPPARVPAVVVADLRVPTTQRPEPADDEV